MITHIILLRLLFATEPSMLNVPGVEVAVKVTKCNQINAYYHPSTAIIELCSELRTLPDGVNNFIAAHEYAHAVVMQRDIPITGSGETSADEYSALALIEAGRVRDVIETALWYASQGGDYDPTDEHGSPAQRSFAMSCLAFGYLSKTDNMCRRRYLTAANNWSRLLTTFGEKSK